MRSPTTLPRTAVGIGVPLVLVALVIALARQDRATRTPPPGAFAGRETIVVALPEAASVAAGRGRRDPLAEIREAEERARQAREELEGVGRELDERKQELERLRVEADTDARRSREEMEKARGDLERLRVDADADARRSREDLEKAQADLERKRGELEAVAQDADRRLKEAREEMQAMERQRRAQLEAAAGAGVARGMGAGAAVPPGLDPRLARRAGVPPLVPEAAIVAAAGGRGVVPAVPPGQGPGLPPVSMPTTAAGTALQGQAALIDAQGRASLASSQAAINARTAEAAALQNRLAATEVFFEQQRINRMARAEQAGPRITMAQAIRSAKAARPPRLDELQLDRATGDIAWPRLLADPAYAPEVAAVEQGFRERAAWGGSLGLAADAELEEAIDTLAERLREDVARHPAGKYGEARVFLDSLRAAVEWYPYE